jgi:outer membrane protein OmpA-like peptidoglycan-associated protein
MKALIFLFMTAFISFGFKNPSPLHNVFFPNESSKLSEVNAQLVKDVYAKLPFGKTVRFGVMGGFASNRSIEERNQLSLNRANSIVELLINQGADVNSSDCFGPL